MKRYRLKREMIFGGDTFFPGAKAFLITDKRFGDCYGMESARIKSIGTEHFGTIAKKRADIYLCLDFVESNPAYFERIEEDTERLPNEQEIEAVRHNKSYTHILGPEKPARKEEPPDEFKKFARMFTPHL